MRTDQILAKIERKSKLPIQNKKAVGFYIKKGERITFFDFECPPRFIDRDCQGREFANYLVDLKSIFQKGKIDQFTELPRVIRNRTKEVKILRFLKSSGLNFCFVKIVADTNLNYITPETTEIIDTERIKKRFKEFRNRVQKAARSYPVPVKVILFSDLIKNFQTEYDSAFSKAFRLLKKEKLISNKILQAQIRRTKKHVGLRQRILEFSQRTIATYAAEGIVFDLLSKTKNFPNCVWLNFEEADKRTVAIINCLRRKSGLGNLPMVCLKKMSKYS